MGGRMATGTEGALLGGCTKQGQRADKKSGIIDT